MSTKHFCEKCGKEISLKGNDYGASRIYFGRSAVDQGDGWILTVEIKREYSGTPEDLCAECVKAMLKEATAGKLAAPSPSTGTKED